MRMAELSRSTGVPVATIKYYLREGLLPAGRPVAATQAEYDDGHVQRLRLIRALLVVGGLSVAAAKAVVDSLDAAPADIAAAVGAAHDALPPPVPPSDEAGPVRALAAIEALGWDVEPDSTGVRQLDAALAGVDSVGLPIGPERLAVYGAAAIDMARIDVGGMPTTTPTAAVHHAVVGTVMYEPVILALRRVAQQHVFRRGPTGEPDAERAGHAGR
jgi:DNA-binding transcriptional MerR regulator